MAKSKKKKNFKLRRRVKRTIAALTMVMAIVVAAIPVENYGTMQASGVDNENLKDNAENYLWEDQKLSKLNNPLYNKNDFEDKYISNDEKTAQHIEGDRFIDAYKINVLGNDAMISKSVFETDIEKFDIYEEEYYDYVKMDSDYLDAIYKTFDNETYELKYEDDSDNSTYKQWDQTITNPDSSTTKLVFEEITVIRVDMDTTPIGSIKNQVNSNTDIYGTTPSIKDKNKYNEVNNTTPDVEKIFTDFAPNILKEHIDKLAKYNRDMKDLTDALDRILAKGNNVTKQDETDWNNTKTNIENLNKTNIEAYRTVSAEFSSIRADEASVDEDKNTLQDLIDYTICQRMSSGNNNLKKYALKRLTTPTDTIVYVPINISGQGPDGNWVNDISGYLAGGKATIKGIKTDAFNPKDGVHTEDNDGEIGTLTIPSSVQFIGRRSFANSNYLKNVTIDDSNCKILGDEAFSGCVHLESIQFTSGNSKLETIGRVAFYNTSLKNIVFPEYVNKIGAGCLFLSGIAEMTMGGLRNGTLEIEPYAFFGCDKLNKVNFAGESTDFKIGEAAFALTADQDGGALTDFAFPSYMN
ncbi:MAG TPA: hypothetical protein DEB74_06405, partial [Lachnospiraceae bacterium]|nr:hypothetical protein [Lachnospiraceae bacterium]